MPKPKPVSYKVEVIADASGQWTGNALSFATLKDARDYAAGLASRWTLVTDWRVVDSNGQVYPRETAIVQEIPVDTSKTNDQLEREAARAAAPAPVPYTLSGVKTFRGMDGQGLNANLLRNGKKVALLTDEGCGGELDFDWLDQKHGTSEEEKLWLAFVEQERAKIPADKMCEFDNTTPLRKLFSGAWWVNSLVDEMANEKRFRKICKTKTVFQVGKEIGGDDFEVLRLMGVEATRWIAAKYPGQKVRILNWEFAAKDAAQKLATDAWGKCDGCGRKGDLDQRVDYPAVNGRAPFLCGPCQGKKVARRG